MLLISYEKDGQARQKVYDLNTSNVINKPRLGKAAAESAKDLNTSNVINKRQKKTTKRQK